MTIKSLSHSSLTDNLFYRSMLVGNTAYDPGSEFVLAEEILTSSQASVTFDVTGLGSTYQHLQLRIVARTDRAELGDVVKVNLNSDTGSNYAHHQLYGNGSSVFSIAATSQTSMDFWRIAGANSAANIFGAIVMDILDPFETTKNTTIRALAGQAGGVTEVYLESGFWNNTAAVTTIALDQIGSNFVSGSSFTLIGVK